MSVTDLDISFKTSHPFTLIDAIFPVLQDVANT